MRQSFEPKIWGPHAWFFLETCVMAYPENPKEEDKEQMRKFLLSLGFVIPCEKCRENYSDHLKKHPLTEEILSDRSELFKWIVDIHNLAGRKGTKSYDETFNYYMDLFEGKEHFENGPTCIKYDTSYLLKISLLITFILTIIFIHLLYKKFCKKSG